MDQVDHGDHNPPWCTRSVQDHLGPRSDIFLMESQGSEAVKRGGHSIGHIQDAGDTGGGCQDGVRMWRNGGGNVQT